MAVIDRPVLSALPGAQAPIRARQVSGEQFRVFAAFSGPDFDSPFHPNGTPFEKCCEPSPPV